MNYSFNYLRPNATAGYSGFVIYLFHPGGSAARSPSGCTWMIPGTFFDDWDNR